MQTGNLLGVERGSEMKNRRLKLRY